MAEKSGLAPGKNVGLPVEPGWNPLLAQKTFDQKQGLGRKRTGAARTGQRQLALVGDLLDVHPAGLGVVHGQRKAAFPIVHPIVCTMLLLGVRDRLGESPNLPLQILRHAGGMETNMVLGDPGNHGFGTNDS